MRREYDRRRYGTPEYRAWNAERMRLRRANPRLRRRELNLKSIHRADRVIAQLTPHQEGAA